MASGGMDNTFVGDFKLTMWIPSELGGKVIGKKGTYVCIRIHVYLYLYYICIYVYLHIYVYAWIEMYIHIHN
jgi:hypothetical protein